MKAKIGLVTGGTRGIGLGIAHALAREGWNLVLTGRRDASDNQEVIESVAASGVEVAYFASDVRDTGGHDALLSQIRERFGALHLLVNNAGVAPLDRNDLLEATEESYDRVMGINLRGPYFLTQAVAKWMISQKERASEYQAAIVNVTSISSTVASPSRGEYCVSKAGLSMMTKLFAVRLGEFGIPVFEVRPGVIMTDMTAGVKQKYDESFSDPDFAPMNRWGTPEDVGSIVAAMARGEMAYATGAAIVVDGGLTIPRL